MTLGMGWRALNPKYLQSCFGGGSLTAKGAGRYNPPVLLYPNAFRVLYVANEFETARSEVAGRSTVPYTYLKIDYRIHCNTVVDLTDLTTRERFGVTLDELNQKGWRHLNSQGSLSVSQKIGILACNEGLEALKIPSAQTPKGHNWIFFVDNLYKGSYVRGYRVENNTQVPIAAKPGGGAKGMARKSLS